MGPSRRAETLGLRREQGCDGYREVVEEIITALSRIRWLFVIARNSSFTYKGRGVDVKQIGRELGVRYLLEGSVRKSGNRVRITAQLVETETGAHVWADRFDGSLENIFDLQDHVATSVAGVIEPTLQAAEMRRSAARPTTDLTAYDLYLRALAAYFPASKESALKALSLLEQAIAIDPHYGRALSWAAVCHRVLAINSWVEAPDASRRKASDLARQALQVTDSDPAVLGNAATFWRSLAGYRCANGAGRPCPRAQPKRRPLLVCQRRRQAVGG